MSRIAVYIGVLLWCPILLGQVAELSIDALTRQFRDFEYQQVIQSSDRILAQNLILSPAEEIEIRRMRAIAFYSLDDIQACLIESLEIIKLDPQYEMDPVQNPPKIVAFFDELRTNFKAENPPPLEEQPPVDSLARIQQGMLRGGVGTRSALIRSAVLPGWGHLQHGHRKRGWLLAMSSAALIGAGLWSWQDTADKERRYLATTDRQAISGAYQEYNDAYRIRNTVLTSLALVWLYAQVDLLYWSPTNGNEPSLAVSPSVQSGDGLSLALQVRF